MDIQPNERCCNRLLVGANEQRTPITNRQNGQSNLTDSLENTKNLREWHGYGMFIRESKIWIMVYGYIRVSSDKNLLLIISIIRMCRLRYRLRGLGLSWMTLF